jgi:hypothetical protein
MLLRNDDDGVLAIGQPSHAWISGQLARAWGNERFPPPEPFDEVCLAAEQHDVGFATWDLEPTRNPDSGLPYSFMEMRLEEHLGLWSPAPRRLLAQSRYAAALVSMHGARLYRRRNLEELTGDQSAAVREYLEAQQRFQDELSVDLDRSQLQRNSDLVWTWDFLSLVVCLDWTPRTARDVPTVETPVDIEITAAGERRVALQPWPFEAGALTVHCEGRRLRGRYESADQLRAALADARWERIEFELVPGHARPPVKTLGVAGAK